MRPDMHARFARPRDDDDYDDLPRRPKKKQGMSVGMILLIVFGSIAAVGCVVCTGAGILMYYGAMKAKEAIDDINDQMNAGRLPPGQGNVLLNQQARLNANDPRRENKPHKAFTVQLEKGKTYVITLMSNEMDSYLFVYDPQGLKIAEDDDSGGGFTGLDSRIHLTADRTGNYVIACTVLGGVPPNGANFTINVRER
jgi:hypothetical protein